MEVAALYADRSNWPVLSAETFPTENFRPIDPILEAVEERCTHIPLDVTLDAPEEMRSRRYSDDVEGAELEIDLLIDNPQENDRMCIGG